MNAKKSNKPQTDDERVIPEAEAEAEAEAEVVIVEHVDPPAPVADEQIIDLGADPASLTPEQQAAQNAANHTDTTGLEEAAATDEVIDLGATSVGNVVIGGGATPEATSPVGITQPLIPVVQDVAEFATMAMPKDELNALDATDPSRAAAIRSQASWAADSAKMFKGPNEEELTLAENLRQMDEMDAINREKLKNSEAAKAKAADIASRDKLLADLRVQYDNLKSQAMHIRGEIERLEALVADTEEEV